MSKNKCLNVMGKIFFTFALTIGHPGAAMMALVPKLKPQCYVETLGHPINQ